MKESMKNKIKQNLKTLDYLEGTGVLSPDARRILADERYLFISSGGNGHKTLSALRQRLMWQVKEKEVREKVAFLAIDASHKEMDELTRNEGFSEPEVYRLPFVGAHDSIAPTTIQGSRKERWVYPDLWQDTHGDAGRNPGFDGEGAGAKRQPGRVRLCQPEVITSLRNTLNASINRLMSNTKGKKLKVFFLAGLSGGTGSGTIVDLAFLTRHIVKSYNENLYKNTQFVAYLLLPSACGAERDVDKASKGNRNAYAALKEIDYFMGLTGRGEHYEEIYGTTVQVDIADNIFNFCTLVEGVGDGAVFFEDPADTARNVTVNSILNLIATPETKYNPIIGRDSTFLVDAFLSNQDEQTRESVLRHSPRDWPRNANYCYNVIGYSRCVIPVDLITVYAASKVFDKVWEQFDKFRDVDEEKARQFLSICQLAPHELYHTKSFNVVHGRIQRAADTEFQKCGPYHMVQLLYVSIQLLEGNDYLGYAQEKSQSALLGASRKNWEETAKRYQRIINEIMSPMNNNLYSVYTEVITVLRDVLEKNGGLLTKAEELRRAFGRSFQWTPVDLTNGATASKSIIEYLDHLISREDIQRKAECFVDELRQKRDEWTQLLPPPGSTQSAFNAAQAIRTFINEQFSEIVKATVETFLVKLYANDPNAEVPELPPDEDPKGHEPIRTAAEKILNGLQTRASALVQTRHGFDLTSCYGNVYITVPDACKWLDKEIKNQAASKGVTEVYRSSSMDELVLYQLYTGVPAWALNWIDEAESCYVMAPEQTGLHIEWKRDGWLWKEFPYLSYERDESAPARRRRTIENEMRGVARNDLEQAQRYNLVSTWEGTDSSVRDNVQKYKVLLLRCEDPNEAPSARQSPEERAQELLNSLNLKQDKTYTIRDVMELLQTNGKAYEKRLYYVGMQMNYAADVSAEFEWELAYNSLRRMMRVWHDLRETLEILEKLSSLIDERNHEAVISQRKEKRRAVFLKGLLYDLLRYNELRRRWYTYVGDETPMGETLESPVQRDCRYYVAAQAFFALEDSSYQRFEERIKRMDQSWSDDKLRENRKKEAELRELLQKQRGMLEREPNSDIRYPMASAEFLDKVGAEKGAEIREFYDWMIEEL